MIHGLLLLKVITIGSPWLEVVTQSKRLAQSHGVKNGPWVPPLNNLRLYPGGTHLLVQRHLERRQGAPKAFEQGASRERRVSCAVGGVWRSWPIRCDTTSIVTKGVGATSH